MIHIIKGFSVVNKAEVDIFLELSCLGTRARKSCVLKYKDLIKLIPFTASSKIFLSKNDWVFFFLATCTGEEYNVDCTLLIQLNATALIPAKGLF